MTADEYIASIRGIAFDAQLTREAFEKGEAIGYQKAIAETIHKMLKVEADCARRIEAAERERDLALQKVRAWECIAVARPVPMMQVACEPDVEIPYMPTERLTDILDELAMHRQGAASQCLAAVLHAIGRPVRVSRLMLIGADKKDLELFMESCPRPPRRQARRRHE